MDVVEQLPQRRGLFTSLFKSLLAQSIEGNWKRRRGGRQRRTAIAQPRSTETVELTCSNEIFVEVEKKTPLSCQEESRGPS